MNRLEVLKQVIAFDRPVDDLALALSQFEWDYEGQPLIIHGSHIRSILNKFLAGEVNAKELENWANLIECRDDLEFDEGQREVLENIIYCLANPMLQGELTISFCENLLGDLDKSDDQ
ncbi:MAG: hypothetical protein U5M23_07190 [Marinagarivorans sp.]|nr:hypothetical protein [Marinagarivorans sp.]